ncbi:hypothetical protein [Bacillus cereus group sp. IBL03679]|uniref:hypothetical protein n=1 Tax=Bacillus cereus group sp. IBL03679 TaxID=3240095 RepID=UPI003D2F8F74
MAVEYKKVIAIKSFSVLGISGGWGVSPRPSFATSYGQTYELESTLATGFITDGFAIDYATALSNPKCPSIIRTKAIRIG